MIDGPELPWYLAEHIYETMWTVLYGRKKSLKELSKQGWQWDQISKMAKQIHKEKGYPALSNCFELPEKDSV